MHDEELDMPYNPEPLLEEEPFTRDATPIKNEAPSRMKLVKPIEEIKIRQEEDIESSDEEEDLSPDIPGI